MHDRATRPSFGDARGRAEDCAAFQAGSAQRPIDTTAAAALVWRLRLRRAYTSNRHATMNVESRLADDPVDPPPCTCTKEDVRQAQALREALRRKLLDRTPPRSDPYWSVGAD
jgi:hypothetical protein